ncbi:FAD-binding oxidoreductase [Apilactobacillus sp. M161]|uniref:FAD-binding oxidoreductase n=1 Tax=Apilactobacillus xinyiensis TaxID=2841032 RepID=A0ABT0HZW5_9LACO|nr:FAD-dependent oxidoreductase [Apilactobacillus xinyiensis]MCK8624124.1 FAD-binding oxidoreductase [Apilactobacillus xinyiensis]
MKKIAIIGGGIVGSTCAYYLSKSSDKVQVTMYDDGLGQATKAAAGIISPWLSKRRNQKWYNLARYGAQTLFDIAKETKMSKDIYNQSGTIVTRDNSKDVDELYNLAMDRLESAPLMGQVVKLTAAEVKQYIPIIDHALPGVFVSGGAKIDGEKYVNKLINIAKKVNLNIVNQKVRINAEGNIVDSDNHIHEYDKIIVTTGAWMKETLGELPFEVDVRPQKGQLIELSLNSAFNDETEDMPVLMPEGERDFIPFSNGRVIIGATHENDKGFDLNPSHEVIDDLLNSAKNVVNNVSEENIVKVKIGTRAYTSDFAPYFGALPKSFAHILVGGGLGSSGLTTGPIMGKILSEMSLDNSKDNLEDLRKPIDNYIKPENN